MTDPQPHDRPTSDRSAWPAWAMLGLAFAGWELFLRLDSQAVSAPTKLWLFVLILGCAVAGFTTVGLAIDRMARALVAPRWQGLVHVPLLVAGAAGLFAAEYLGVVHYFSPEQKALWPLAAGAGSLYALAALVAAPRLIVRAPALQRALVSGRVSVVLLVALSLATLMCTTAALRSDAAACLLKANTVLGRAAAWPLAHLRRPLDATTAPAARAADRPAQQSIGRHDVVLITVDTLRADALTAYNPTAAASPAIERLAAQSIVFESAYVQRCTSAPSMASILTGLYPAQHTVRQNAMVLPDQMRTLAEYFAGAGFATAGFVTNINFDRAFNFQQGFADYEFFDAPTDEDGLMLDASDVDAVDAGLAWTKQQDGKPVFLWVHLMAPHAPYLPPADLRPTHEAGSGRWFNVLNMPFNHARVGGLETYFDRDAYLSLYAAEVAAADREIGRLLDGLAGLGRLDDAHVIFAGDHGESFGEGDVFGHGHGLHPAETQVPMMWKLPGGRRAGARIAMTVQAADIAPSLLRLAGISASARAGDEAARPVRLDGRDVSGILLAEQAEDDGFAFSEAGYIGALGARGLKYAVRTRARTIWLDLGFPYTSEFDRSADPAETRPHRYTKRNDDSLFEQLAALASAAEIQLADSAGRVALDPEQEERLRALGYMW